MEPPTAEDDFTTPFYVGQHESKRSSPVTSHVLRQAQNCNVCHGFIIRSVANMFS